MQKSSTIRHHFVAALIVAVLLAFTPATGRAESKEMAALQAQVAQLIDMVQRLGGAARAGFALSLFWLAGNLGSFAITWLLSFPAETGDWRVGGIALVVVLLVQAALAFVALAPVAEDATALSPGVGVIGVFL